MTPKELRELAHEIINQRLDNQESVHMEWAVREVISHQGVIEGDGVVFYEFCAREVVWRTVKRVVDRYAPKVETDHQLLLEGYERIQSAYTIVRAGDICLVPIELLTHEELTLRANEYLKLGEGCRAHAVELMRYRDARGYELPE